MAGGSVNKVILVGRLGRDPELRYTQAGQAVVNFTMATDEVFNDKSGQRQERTEWHKIVAWARLAEICAEYLSKGRQIYIEGRLQTREWEDKEGNKRWTTEIVARDMQMLGSRGDAGGRRDAGSRDAAPGDAGEGPGAGAGEGGAGPQSGPDPFGPEQPDDDIPF